MLCGVAGGIGRTSAIRIREIGAVPVCSDCKEHHRRVAEMPPFREPVDPQVAVSDAVKAIAPDAEDAATAKPWKEVGTAFHTWLETLQATSEPAPTIVLAAFNGKRFDSRIWAFENKRHGITNVPVDLHFVDLMAVFRKLMPEVVVPRTLARYHEQVLKRPIVSAHTALGDSYALRDLINHVPNAALWAAIDQHVELADGVYRRCGLPVPSTTNEGGGQQN